MPDKKIGVMSAKKKKSGRMDVGQAIIRICCSGFCGLLVLSHGDLETSFKFLRKIIRKI